MPGDGLDCLALLEQDPTFSFLPTHELERLAGMAVGEKRPAGSLVFREGEPGDAFYIVASGLVAVMFYRGRGESP